MDARLGVTTCDKCGEPMKNSEVARVFLDIADLLKLKGGRTHLR